MRHSFWINCSLFKYRWIFLGQGGDIVRLFAFHINHVISKSRPSSSVKRTVFIFVIMHFHDDSIAEIFVHRCQRRYFNQTFYRCHYPNGMIACGWCFIWQASFVKNYSAFCSRHSVHVFFYRFISCIEIKFKPQRLDRGFLFKGFF